MDSEEGIRITVNMTGDPAVPTLVDVATDTDSGVGFIVR
jgi:hypothetical protein